MNFRRASDFAPRERKYGKFRGKSVIVRVLSSPLDFPAFPWENRVFRKFIWLSVAQLRAPCVSPAALFFAPSTPARVGFRSTKVLRKLDGERDRPASSAEVVGIERGLPYLWPRLL